MEQKFSEQEIRALLVLLPFIAATVWLVHSYSHSSTNHTEIIEAVTQLKTTSQPHDTLSVELFTFDPNTATYEDFRHLGIDKQTATNIIKYRTAGKIFRIAEDLATCYGMTDSLFLLLRPYIQIDDAFTIKPRTDTPTDKSSSTPQVKETVSIPSQPFDPNKADENTFMQYGFTARQAHTICNYRESCGGFRNADHFGRCYAVSEEMLELLRPLMLFEPSSENTASQNTTTIQSPSSATEITPYPRNKKRIELNSADSIELVSVNGIGAWSASEILKYRERLGGFAKKEQLLDLKAITEENYRKICEQIWIDSCEIQKIDINFASPKSMAEHPYMTSGRLRKILKHRKLKGGWSTIEEMTEENILTEEEARKLAPYLQFVQKRP